MLYSGHNNDRTKIKINWHFATRWVECCQNLIIAFIENVIKIKINAIWKMHRVTRVRCNGQLSDSASWVIVLKIWNGIQSWGYTDNNGCIYIKKLQSLPHFLSDAQINFKENFAIIVKVLSVYNSLLENNTDDVYKAKRFFEDFIKGLLLYYDYIPLFLFNVLYGYSKIWD